MSKLGVPLYASYYSSKTPGSRRPKYLTPTERHRFTRTYYQLWGMMRLDPSQWQTTLDSLTLKAAYLLRELCCLNSNIGSEEEGSTSIRTGCWPYPSSRKRAELKHFIDAHIDRFQAGRGEGSVEWPWVYWRDCGIWDFVVIWDHWQETQKWICTGRKEGENVGSVDEEFEKRVLWDDSENEESEER